MKETEGFARKAENCGEAGFRKANRRLQPLGHLTATRTLSINAITICDLSKVPSIVPEIVPAKLSESTPSGNGQRGPSADPNAAVLFADNHPGN